MNTHVIDQKARDMAQQAISQIDAHEDKCEVRWTSAMTTMKDIKSILAWGTATLIGSMGAVIMLLLSRTH